tara:strand:+ start:720 stop:2420 length:1701 start_codon:yes stop_codon:yes gene_type:complete
MYQPLENNNNKDFSTIKAQLNIIKNEHCTSDQAKSAAELIAEISFSYRLDKNNGHTIKKIFKEHFCRRQQLSVKKQYLKFMFRSYKNQLRNAKVKPQQLQTSVNTNQKEASSETKAWDQPIDTVYGAIESVIKNIATHASFYKLYPQTETIPAIKNIDNQLNSYVKNRIHDDKTQLAILQLKEIINQINKAGGFTDTYNLYLGSIPESIDIIERFNKIIIYYMAIGNINTAKIATDLLVSMYKNYGSPQSMQRILPSFTYTVYSCLKDDYTYLTMEKQLLFVKAHFPDSDNEFIDNKKSNRKMFNELKTHLRSILFNVLHKATDQDENKTWAACHLLAKMNIDSFLGKNDYQRALKKINLTPRQIEIFIQTHTPKAFNAQSDATTKDQKNSIDLSKEEFRLSAFSLGWIKPEMIKLAIKMLDNKDLNSNQKTAARELFNAINQTSTNFLASKSMTDTLPVFFTNTLHNLGHFTQKKSIDSLLHDFKNKLEQISKTDKPLKLESTKKNEAKQTSPIKKKKKKKKKKKSPKTSSNLQDLELTMPDAPTHDITVNTKKQEDAPPLAMTL